MDPAFEPDHTQELFLRARDGDERALRLLYQRYIGRIRAWARGKLSPGARDIRDTDVLSHEVLQRVLLKVPYMQPEHSNTFERYARVALRNALATANGRAHEAKLTLEELAERLEDTAPTPLEETIAQEFGRAVQAAFDELPARQRKAILLHRVHEMPYRLVAQMAGFSSEDAARMACNRGFRQLKERLREMGGDDDQGPVPALVS